MQAGRLCQVGGRFSRCRNTAENACQYCGRWFCGSHTHHLQDHDAVCARTRCVAKHDDLVAHVAYKRRVYERNQVGLCGIEECGPHPGFQCSLCQGHFCVLHLTERMYPFKEGWVSIDRPVSVCQQCWARRKIWRGK